MTLRREGRSLMNIHRMPSAWTVTALFLVSAVPVFSQTSPYHLLQVESLGIPAQGLSPFEGLGINDLKFWNGRIYIGHGEGTINTGPTEIISFDPAENRFLNEFLTDENCIWRFRVLDGQLVIPGQDRIKSASGSVYVLTEDGWTQHSSVPSTSHVLDAAVFRGWWYVSTGGDSFRFRRRP